MNPSLEMVRARREMFPRMEPLVNIKGVNVEPLALYKELDSKKVKQYLEIFSTQFSKNHVEFEKNISGIIDKIAENKTEEIDPHQMLAVLFLASRNRWKELDLRKEQKSIEAVCEMLVGNHVNLTQGDGKTTAVIPIYSVARALLHKDDPTVSQPALVISTSDSTKLGELQQEIRGFKKKFIDLIGSDEKKEKIGEKLVDCQIPDTNSDSILNQRPVDIYRFAQVNGIKILLLTHNQLIFESEKLTDKWGQFPPVVVDEVHLLDKASFYTSLNTEVQESDKITDPELSNYFFSRLISSEFENNQDFLNYVMFTGKKPYLKTEGETFLHGLGKKINGLSGDNSKQLNALVKQISDETKIPVSKIKDIVKKTWSQLETKRNRKTANSKATDYIGKSQDYLQDLFLEFVSIKMNLHEGGDFYEGTRVRDPIRGLALPSHKFDFQTRFWLGVINKKIIPFEDELVDHRFHFSSWLAAVTKGRIIGLSGSLYEQDLKGKMIQSHLAKTLTDFSEGLVTNLSPEQKPLPVPFINITRSEDQLIEQVIKKANGFLYAHKPHFIVCWNDVFADTLLTKLKGLNVNAVVINKDSSPEDVDQTMHKLADGKIQIVISSGQGSFGQNIKTSLDNFPDLKVSVINPETEFQVSQAFRRNRLEGKSVNDFAIFFDKNYLLLLSSYLPEKQQKSLIKLISQREAIEKKYENSPELADLVGYLRGIDEKIKQITVDALMASQHRKDSDEIYIISQDILFLKYIDPMIRDAKKEIYGQEIEKSGFFEKRLNKFLKGRFPGIGKKILDNLLIELKLEVINHISHTESSLYHEYLIDFSTFNINPDNRKMDREISIKNLWDNRIKNMKKQWKKDLGQEYFWEKQIDPYLEQRVADFEIIAERIGNFLKSPEGQKVNEEKILFYILVDLPFYPYEKESHMLDTRRVIQKPYGQLRKESSLGRSAVESLTTARVTGKPTRSFITAPSNLPYEGDETIRRFYLAKEMDAYLALITELHPDLFSDKTTITVVGGDDSELKPGAYLIPTGAKDTKGILVIIDN